MHRIIYISESNLTSEVDEQRPLLYTVTIGHLHVPILLIVYQTNDSAKTFNLR